MYAIRKMVYAKRIFQKKLESRHVRMLTVIQQINEETMAELLYRAGHFIVYKRYIVPYNAGLLKIYKSHINIEACASVKSVKYSKVMTVLICR